MKFIVTFVMTLLVSSFVFARPGEKVDSLEQQLKTACIAEKKQVAQDYIRRRIEPMAKKLDAIYGLMTPAELARLKVIVPQTLRRFDPTFTFDERFVFESEVMSIMSSFFKRADVQAKWASLKAEMGEESVINRMTKICFINGDTNWDCNTQVKNGDNYIGPFGITTYDPSDIAGQAEVASLVYYPGENSYSVSRPGHDYTGESTLHRYVNAQVSSVCKNYGAEEISKMTRISIMNGSPENL